MRQIKTIVRPVDYSAGFDAEVNAAIMDGWRLVSRRLTDPISLPGNDVSAYTARVLYAELERNEPEYPEEVTL